jgi:hypothetical protein
MEPTDKNLICKNILAGILIATGVFSAVVLLGNTWIKLIVISLIVASGIIWLFSHGSLRRAIKCVIITLMVFTISFSTLEIYLFWNAGYPQTFTPSQPGVTISYPNILNASLTGVVQSAKNTPAFNLIALEYFGQITFESIKLDTSLRGGRVEVVFCQDSSSLGFRFVSSGGHSYHVSIFSWDGQPFSRTYPQEQTSKETLEQIDALGLRWFYDSTIRTYQNRTGVNPDINALQVSVQWENYGNYQGMTLLLIGSYESNFSGHGVFFADFQPNGTLLYLNIAS